MAITQLSMPDDNPVRTWKVLVAAPFPPRLDGRHGGSRVLGQLLYRLGARHSVGLVVLRGRDELGVDEMLRSACNFVEEVEIPDPGHSLGARMLNRARIRAALLRGVPTWAAERTVDAFGVRLEELIRSWQPDLVQFEYRIMGQFLPVLADATPRVLVDHDPASSDGRPSRLVAPLESRAWATLGRAVSRQVDALVVFTERDRRTIARLSPAAPLACIPIGYDIPERPLDPTGANDLEVIYVGSFIHPPNVDAATRLARRIFPQVRASIPDATLRIVGSYPSPQIEALAGSGVHVLPDVPDVTPYLDAAAVFAAPIRTGGGMRVKVLEALAYGKAVVASPLAIEGVGLKAGEHVLVADDDSEFAAALVTLLLDPGRRQALARAARAWAKEHLDLESTVRAYEELYASVCREAARGPLPAAAALRDSGADRQR
jgi:glycosyltransferase involved in cell wall biosynthesis